MILLMVSFSKNKNDAISCLNTDRLGNLIKIFWQVYVSGLMDMKRKFCPLRTGSYKYDSGFGIAKYFSIILLLSLHLMI